MSRLPGENLTKIYYIFLSYCPLKFRRWIPHQKNTDPYFLSLGYFPLWIYAPFKGS